jgi:hypothetical protein
MFLADSERDWCPSLSCLVGQPGTYFHSAEIYSSHCELAGMSAISDLGNLNESSVSGRNFWSDRVDDIHSSAGRSADDAMEMEKESTGRGQEETFQFIGSLCFQSKEEKN